jgi:hypothetical protein
VQSLYGSTIAARLQEKTASRGEEVVRAWKICFIEKQAYKQGFLKRVRPNVGERWYRWGDDDR